MKIIRAVFYGFFLLFNLLYLCYNISQGFDWSSALVPFLITIFCGANLYFLWKNWGQSK
ncbi:hypothetical protein J2T50_001199 [Streptococcus gallinaceus]|uniref:hypothetical protein n=1 Tax=Streptococcus gallinaceus TaxID=165758 RepID=UPI00061D5DB0|nr:hypothetical protein [Streptococcus gallinaceus]MCP1639499.1 hypothetical protein [Streptococcus gallinaceus]MCP1770282.1 hypothetical protein [Streptococcus gallinaceus]CRH86188.1 Uncharacterised protein [Chlamydia trachomatis]CRH91103.1 Uncharacterised protein [Chlamydia trachomatis]